MYTPVRFSEISNLHSVIVPLDLQTARDGDWINVSNYHHVVLVLFKAAGTAGDDPTVTIQQATDNAGTGAKDLTFTSLYVKQGTLTSAAQGVFSKVTQTAAATYTEATSAETQAIWVFEFDSDELDVNNSFNHVRLNVSDVGNNAQLGCAFCILMWPRQAGPVASMPSAID